MNQRGNEIIIMETGIGYQFNRSLFDILGYSGLATILALMLLLPSPPAQAQESLVIGGSVTGVSAYLDRGVKRHDQGLQAAFGAGVTGWSLNVWADNSTGTTKYHELNQELSYIHALNRHGFGLGYTGKSYADASSDQATSESMLFYRYEGYQGPRVKITVIKEKGDQHRDWGRLDLGYSWLTRYLDVDLDLIGYWFSQASLELKNKPHHKEGQIAVRVPLLNAEVHLAGLVSSPMSAEGKARIEHAGVDGNGSYSATSIGVTYVW